MDNPYWKMAFAASLPTGLKTRSDLLNAIESYSKELDVSLKTLLVGGIVSLQVDGGKDIMHNKLLITCLVMDHMAMLHEMLDTKWETLNKGCYNSHSATTLNDMLEYNCMVVSITMDNEAAPNAGVEAAIRDNPLAKHVIHFRCGAHTIELMMDSVAQSFGWINKCLEDVRSVVTTIKSKKALCKKLRDMQAKDGVRSPMTLVTTANTRKWSSGYLTLSRALQLREYIDDILSDPEYNGSVASGPNERTMDDLLLTVYFSFFCAKINGVAPQNPQNNHLKPFVHLSICPLTICHSFVPCS